MKVNCDIKHITPAVEKKMADEMCGQLERYIQQCR